jgi:hypothetical protein
MLLAVSLLLALLPVLLAGQQQALRLAGSSSSSSQGSEVVKGAVANKLHPRGQQLLLQQKQPELLNGDPR